MSQKFFVNSNFMVPLWKNIGRVINSLKVRTRVNSGKSLTTCSSGFTTKWSRQTLAFSSSLVPLLLLVFLPAEYYYTCQNSEPAFWVNHKMHSEENQKFFLIWKKLWKLFIVTFITEKLIWRNFRQTASMSVKFRNFHTVELFRNAKAIFFLRWNKEIIFALTFFRQFIFYKVFAFAFNFAGK